MSAVAEALINPVSCSAQGNNTCLVRCKVYGGMRHYAVCLNLISKVEAGTPSEYDTPCNSRIEDASGCPALDMRAQEQAAGKALFYEPRESSHFPAIPKGTTIFDRGFEIGWQKAGNNQPLAPAKESTSSSGSHATSPVARVSAPAKSVSPPKAEVLNMATPNYADAVNTMMKEQAKPASGGLLEVARRMREANNAK